MAFFAWLLTTFGVRVFFQRLKESEKQSGLTGGAEDNGILDKMTIDDIVFVFVQVEHNINKWKLIYEAWKQKHIPTWSDKQRQH